MFIYGIPCGIVRYLTHVKVKRTAARSEISNFLSSVVCNEGFYFLIFYKWILFTGSAGPQAGAFRSFS